MPGVGLEGEQALHPDRPPIPRVGLEQFADDPGDRLAIAQPQSDLDLGEHHLRGALRGTFQRTHPLPRILQGDRRDPARHRVGRVGQQPGQLPPVETFAGGHRRAEQRGRRRGRRSARGTPRHHLAQHPHRLNPQVFGGLETVRGQRRASPLYQPVERVVLGEQRHLAERRQRVDVFALIAAELRTHHQQRAAERVDVAGHRRTGLGDLGGLVADRAEDRGRLVRDPAHRAQIDQLDRVAHLHEVVGFEIAVQQAVLVEVGECRQDLDQIGERPVDRQRIVASLVGRLPLLQQVGDGAARHVLHDDVAGVGVLDEVVDLDDQWVLDRRQELLLRLRRGRRVVVGCVQ